MNEHKKYLRNSPMPPIVPALDFLADRIQEPPQVIHGVIRAGQVGMMAASSKAGKSWALLSLAYSVANGTEWLDWQTTKGRVLYINAELPAYDLQARLDTISSTKQHGPELIDVWHLRGQGRAIKALIPAILEAQDKNGNPYSLIIPDPLYCFGEGRDENDNAEQAKTMGELSELAERSTAAVFAAHHFSKGNKSQTDHLDRASGAGMFARAVDTFMTFTRLAEEDCYVVETTTRSFVRPAAFGIRWKYPVWDVDASLDPDDLKKIGASQKAKKATADQLASLIPSSGIRHKEFMATAAARLGIGRSTFNALLRECRSRRLLNEVTGLYTPCHSRGVLD